MERNNSFRTAHAKSLPLSKSALFKMLAQKRIIAMHNNSTYYTLKVNEGGMEKEIRVVRIPRDVFRWKPLQSIR